MNRLRQARLAKGYSQAKLAQLTGINQVTICRLENGRETLFAGWAKRLKVALDYPGEASSLCDEVEEVK